MTILVTGGTKGIGFAIAQRFAKPGTDVFLNYHSDEAAAANAKQTIDQLGARAYLIRADVGTPAGALAAIDQVNSHTDRLDQLVHCAVRVIAKPALEADLDDFTRAVNLNGNALLYLVKAALPLLQRGSSVFFLSSRGSRIVIKNYAAVGVGKAAQLGAGGQAGQCRHLRVQRRGVVAGRLEQGLGIGPRDGGELGHFRVPLSGGPATRRGRRR